MKKITTKVALLLWDKLRWLEKSTDNELAIRAKVSQGTISKWRSNPNQTVRFSTIRQIEENLNYSIEYSDSGQWIVEKKNQGTGKTDAEKDVAVHFFAPNGVSDEVRMKYEAIARKISEIDPKDVDMIRDIVDKFTKK
jgi:transcriptional regulator with XRE-family HTH domain